jgi:hypothetical protein
VEDAVDNVSDLDASVGELGNQGPDDGVDVDVEEEGGDGAALLDASFQWEGGGECVADASTGGGIRVEALDVVEEVGGYSAVAEGFPKRGMVDPVERLWEVDVGHMEWGVGAVGLLLEAA